MKKQSDYALHPPCGSSVPGKIDSNIYMSVPPNQLRSYLEIEQDPDERAKMMSALKQYERQYVDMVGYPWRVLARKVVRAFWNKSAEIVNPAINVPVYQDSETPQGHEEVIDSLEGLYDNDNAKREDYARQGLRPIRDIDTSVGDFSAPKESPFGIIITKPQGDGPDPINMECPFPPTGGDIDTY